MIKVTDHPSKYRHLESMSVAELTANINNEDKTVALAIEKVVITGSKFISGSICMKCSNTLV